MQLLPALPEADLTGFRQALGEVQRITGARLAPVQVGVFPPGVTDEPTQQLLIWGRGVSRGGWRVCGVVVCGRGRRRRGWGWSGLNGGSGGLAGRVVGEVGGAAVGQGGGGWTMTGRTSDLQRFSPLTQINKANVKNLKAAWTFSTGVLNGHEGNPLVIGTTMKVQSAFPNIVFTLNVTKEGAPLT